MFFSHQCLRDHSNVSFLEQTDPWPQSRHPPGTPPASPFACISHYSLCLQVACAILLSLNNVNIHSIWLLSYRPTFSLLFIVDFLSQSTVCYFLLTPPGSKPSLGVLTLRAPMIPGRSQASQPSHSMTQSKVNLWVSFSSRVFI